VAEDGFDTSGWQEGVWDGTGRYRFALTKFSEGVGFKDSAADRHFASFARPGFIRGGYHFARADLNPGTAGAYAEADWFWRVATSMGDVRAMLLANDMETAAGSGGPLGQWRDDFNGRLEWRLGGGATGWYSYWHFITSHGLNYPCPYWLWLAWPSQNGPLPASNDPIEIVQDGLTTVSGIAGGVDYNRYPGTLDQLARLTVGGAPTTSPTGEPAMAVGQCLYLNGVNHVFLLGADGVVKWSAVSGGAGGLQNPATSYVNVPCFSTDIRDIWVSQDRGPARPDGSGDVIDRILLFAAFGDSTWSFCVLNPSDSSYKAAEWSEPLPGMHLRARVPMYQGQALPAGPAGPEGPPGQDGADGAPGATAAEVVDELGRRIANG
jgi:GH25 family lysozyme M1 (1,4-beta-N-acetylmuramidase)